MGLGHRLALGAGAAAIVIATTAGAQQKVTGPTAVYWMSARTQTGFGMGAMGAGGKPDAGAMMRMMMGGGGGDGAMRTLHLDLGSSQTNATPAADHLPPTGLGAGPRLPLTYKPAPSGPGHDTFERPRGKLLIYWGCGEHARPGQPVVIDFAQVAAGKMPPGLKGLDYRPMQPPSASRNTTYGEWPNTQTRNIPASLGSLVGAHTVQGNYSPQINFTLAEDQDFLGPLNLTTNARGPGGWVNLGWNLVPNAQAYLANAVSGKDDNTVVVWTSSETQTSTFGLPDYLSPGDITRLVAAKALMGPATRTCAVPKEFLDAAPQAIVMLTAYGDEANFVYPPRPTNPKVAWNQEWAVKVRYTSATGGLLGQPMPSMGGGDDRRAGGKGDKSKPAKPPSAKDILKKGILGGGLPF